MFLNLFRYHSTKKSKEEVLKMLDNRIPEGATVGISVVGQHLDQFSLIIHDEGVEDTVTEERCEVETIEDPSINRDLH